MEKEKHHAKEIFTHEGNVSVFPQVNFANPELKMHVQELGFDPQLFQDLITLNYNQWDGSPVSTPYPQDQPVEELIIRTATTGDNRKVEVTEVTAYEPSKMITRLVGKPNQSIGFEAVYVTEGSMTYDILKEFEYNDGSCINTGKGCNSIELKSGDLLIIPRPVARQITDVKPGTKYVYLGDPWTDDDKPQEVS